MHEGLTNKILMFNLYITIILWLLGLGGKEAALHERRDGSNALHVACERFCGDPIVISELINCSGATIMTEKNKKDHLPIHSLLLIDEEDLEDAPDLEIEKDDDYEENIIIAWKIMLEHGIVSFAIGGEFGFAGLFDSSSDEVQQCILKKWDKHILPGLKSCSRQLFEEKAPILQSALVKKAPTSVIKDMVEKLNFISIKDSMGRYPIDVAVQLKLGWDEGMRDIVYAFATAQDSSPVIICARHGVTWENGMKDVVEENKIGLLQEQEKGSGLYPFMLAGMEKNYVLGSVFHLIRRSPGVVQRYDSTCSENVHVCRNNQTGRRRSRRVQETSKRAKRRKVGK